MCEQQVCDVTACVNEEEFGDNFDWFSKYVDTVQKTLIENTESVTSFAHRLGNIKAHLEDVENRILRLEAAFLLAPCQASKKEGFLPINK
jgi:hypothetical protein